MPPGRWVKGESGNPRGKPRGARHKITLAAQALLDGEAEALTRKCIEAALGGDMVAMRLCLERILPPIKSRRVTLDLPKVEQKEDLPRALAALWEGVAMGDLAPHEAEVLAGILGEMDRLWRELPPAPRETEYRCVFGDDADD